MKRSKDAGRVEESAGSGGKEAREAAEKKASQWHRTNIPWMLDWRTDLTQILLPVEPGAPYLSGGAGSNAPGVKWSTVDKDSAVDVSVDGYTASCLTGHRSVRATHSVCGGGAWYYEVEICDVSDQVSKGPGGAGHCRVGVAMDRVIFEDLDAPVGFAPHGSERGYSYSYGSRDGNKFNRSVPEKYGEPYKAGDVIGCLLVLPPTKVGGDGDAAMKPYYSSAVVITASRHHCKRWLSYYLPVEPKIHEGSRLCFYRNGVPQGDAYHGIWAGNYYPAVSCYYGGACRARFSEPFKHFPGRQGGGVLPEGVEMVRPWGDAASEPTPFLDQGVKVMRREEAALEKERRREERQGAKRQKGGAD